MHPIVSRILTPPLAALAVAGLAWSIAPCQAAALPASLTLVDINNPIEGSVVDNGDGSWTVTAGGGDTWDNADSFTYLYEQRSGDFDVRVQVLNLEVDDINQQDSAKASLHIRASLDAGSPDVMLNVTPDPGPNHYVETIYRKRTGEGTDDPPVNKFQPNLAGPYDGTYRRTDGKPLYSPADGLSTWLRMRRVGNSIKAYISTDGQHWQMLTDFSVDPDQFPNDLYVGMATVAHISSNENIDNRARATYANYGDTPAPIPNVAGTPVDAGASPGVYPSTGVLAANWKVVIPDDGKAPDGSYIMINGNKKNELILSIDGESPVGWSAPGYNQGDIDISLAPRDPVAAQQNEGPYSNPDRNISQVDPASPVTQAWLPSTREGVVLATIRKNQQQWNDDGAGGPTAPFSAFVSVSVDFSSRKGFSMNTGDFENGEIYVSCFKIGESQPDLPAGASPHALREANIDLATAWFPFAQGWIAGYLGDATKGPEAFWSKQGSHSARAVDGTAVIDKVSSKAIFKWLDRQDIDGNTIYGGLGQLVLPNVDAYADGMLFTISNDDESDNEGQIVGAAPFDDGIHRGWNIAIRQDDGDYDPTSYSQASRSEFGFVYIPYTAGNLVGGYIQGATGNKLQGAGTFAVKRLDAGRYELTIPGKTGTDGMLILQNAGYLATDATIVDDAALSYEYQGGNKFIIESHAVIPGGQDVADKIITRDTDFYVAWVDFKNPLTPVPLASVSLQSSASVQGPYADEAGASVDTAAKTITVAKSGAARFYRVSAGTALHLKSVQVQGNNVVIAYE
jgi:hypothetical protein